MQLRPLACFAIVAAAILCGSAHAQSCVSDEDCQDGVWCNGIERCEGNPTRSMCMPAPRPMCSAKKMCDEAAKKCIALDAVRKVPVCAEGEAWSAADNKCVATPR